MTEPTLPVAAEPEADFRFDPPFTISALEIGIIMAHIPALQRVPAEFVKSLPPLVHRCFRKIEEQPKGQQLILPGTEK